MSNILTAAPKSTDAVCDAIMKPFKARPRAEQASSVAEARELVQAWAGTDYQATPSAPVLFLIGPNVFVADGTDIKAANPTEYYFQYYNNTEKEYSIGQGGYSGMIDMTLPPRGYKRVAKIEAQAWGRPKNNAQLNLAISVNGVITSYARFPGGVTDVNVSANTAWSIEVPAGESPKISMGIHVDYGGTGRIILTPNQKLTRLFVQTWVGGNQA